MAPYSRMRHTGVVRVVFALMSALVAGQTELVYAESLRSPDGRYEAVEVPSATDPLDIHYQVREIKTGRVFKTFAKFSTANDVKAGQFSPDSKQFAAAYHYGHEGERTWVGVWNTATGKLAGKPKEVDGFIRGDLSRFFTQSISVRENVLTQHNDNARTGAYLAETRLKPSNISVSSFGKLYSLTVDGPIAAQPLFVKGVTINGVAKDVLYVATRKNKIHAFDVGAPEPSTLWQKKVKPKDHPDLSAADLPGMPDKCGQLQGPVGITSTPVIDPATSTMFVVFRTGKDPSPTSATRPRFSQE